jgi:hypothetical protein
MQEFFNMLLPSEYWKFFTNVNQWDKNELYSILKDVTSLNEERDERELQRF